MAERKLINVYVSYNGREYIRVGIPADIDDEVKLKACLRDLGYISSYRRSYLTTKVYLEDSKKTSRKEICTEEYRSLEDLGVVENSLIVIEEGEPEPRTKTTVIYRGGGSVNCLYGCPMAQSVEEAMSQAEMYSDNDSVVTTGSIGTD